MVPILSRGRSGPRRGYARAVRRRSGRHAGEWMPGRGMWVRISARRLGAPYVNAHIVQNGTFPTSRGNTSTIRGVTQMLPLTI